jgi:hypothetical protein
MSLLNSKAMLGIHKLLGELSIGSSRSITFFNLLHIFGRVKLVEFVVMTTIREADVGAMTVKAAGDRINKESR